MRVVLAQPRGFCAGVVRAIDVVEGALPGVALMMVLLRRRKEAVWDLRSAGPV